MIRGSHLREEKKQLYIFTMGNRKMPMLQANEIERGLRESKGK
jgi:hypothetical protein